MLVPVPEQGLTQGQFDRLDDGLLYDEAEPFGDLLKKCKQIRDLVNAG